MEYLKRRYLFNGPFATIVLFIYNYFLIDYMFRYLGCRLDFNLLISICLFLAFINILSTTVEIKSSHTLTRYLMEISEIWKWASLMFLFILIFLYIMDLFVQIPKLVVLLLYIMIIALGIYGYYNAHSIKVKYKNLPILKNESSESVVLIHVSDVHIGSIRRKQTLEDLKDKVNSTYGKLKQEKIDNVFLIISGDLVDGSCPIAKEDLEPLGYIKPKTIFTPGNHDYYQNIDDLKKNLSELGITVLDNDMLELESLNLNFIGLSFDYDNSEKFMDKNNINLPIDNLKTNILIFHLPIYFEYFASLGIDLQLSGHTHGGQFYPANLWVKLFYPRLKGLYSIDIKNKPSYLSVSNGLGTMGPPIRIGTDSEIVVYRLVRR